MNHAELQIRYKGSGILNEDDDIDLGLLGESIKGFDQLFKDITQKVFQIDTEVSVKAKRASNGSIILHILIQLSGHPEFHHVLDLIDFIKLTDPVHYANLISQIGREELLGNITKAPKDLLDKIDAFARERPGSFYILTSLPFAIIGVVKAVKKLKNMTTIDSSLPKRFLPRVKRIVRDKKFKKPFKPFTEGEVSELEIFTPGEKSEKAKISDSDFGDYLPKNEEIIPEWEDGQEVTISGSVVSLQCTHGDTLKVKVNGKPRKHQLMVAVPPTGKSTSDYLKYYREDVWIKATVKRKSLFQKPILHIKDMELDQQTI